MQKFKMEDVVCVYKGNVNSCMCGCSGDYAYTERHRKYASKDRGYKVEDSEVNERKVNARLQRYYKEPQKPYVVNGYIFSKEIGSKQITVYLKEKK